MPIKTRVLVPDRRATQRTKLIACAEKAIAKNGLSALRARSLADCVGCSLGAIYNLVSDLDELILLVAQRTMSDLNARLDTVDAPDRFEGWALAYCRFAAENRNRWRALFEFRLPVGRALPDWFETDQIRLFERLETELAVRLPNLPLQERRLRTRTLFSAVHGIVTLGLEEKLAAMPATALETELKAFVSAYLVGLAAK